MKRISLLAVATALAGCAALQPAGRSAQAPAAIPAATATSQPAPTAAPQPAGPVAAPNVTVAPPAPTRPAVQTEPSDGSIVVPGGPERQVPPPSGDPRSIAERMEDVRAWDQCVTAVQAAFEADPMRPQLETPEDYCSRSLGMANRTAVPEGRRR